MNLVYSIRHAELADLPRIVSIYNQTIPGRMVTADLEAVTVEDRLAWFHAHQPGHRPLWVVSDEANIVFGWISLQDFYGRPAYQKTAEISIYLDQAFQGKGYGATLLNDAFTRCREIGVERLLGFIFSHNVASVRLFERAGFERWGLLPGVAELDARKTDLSIYGLHLGARDQ
jgi:L-amino acid N-acyltransferase YncA